MAEMLKASDILDEPEIIDDIEGKYQIIHDESNTGFKFDNLNNAVCLMAEKGWRCLSISGEWGIKKGDLCFSWFIYPMVLCVEMHVCVYVH